MSDPPKHVIPATDVYDVIYHQTEPVPTGSTVTFPSDDTTLSGRYLVIHLLSGAVLELCEVEVYGASCSRYILFSFNSLSLCLDVLAASILSPMS